MKIVVVFKLIFLNYYKFSFVFLFECIGMIIFNIGYDVVSRG